MADSTQDRLAAEWEKVKHLLPDSELKTFICRAIMIAMETWSGGEPPKPKTLTFTSVPPAPDPACFHTNVEWVQNNLNQNGLKCQKCGVLVQTWTHHGGMTPYSSLPHGGMTPYSSPHHGV